MSEPGKVWAVAGVMLAILSCTDTSAPISRDLRHTPTAAVAAGVGADINDVVADLKAQIQALVSLGALNQGQGNSLGRKLDRVVALNAQGNTAEAQAVLQDFINQVNDLMASGRWLSAAQAAQLTNSSLILMTLLGPHIAAFTTGDGATCVVILTGSSVTLLPTFTGGSGSIDQGVGPVTSGTPVEVVPPFLKESNGDISYTLTVTDANGSAVIASVRVLVLLQPVEVVLPDIKSFDAVPAAIAAGGSATLTAVFNGGSGSIDQGVGPVASGVGIPVAPPVTTVYTLTVTSTDFCKDRTLTKSVTVSVN